MAHIVVIGVGLGGVPAALELRKRVGKEHRLTLIACSPYLEFAGSNPWIAVGWRKCERWRAVLQGPLEADTVDRGNDPGDRCGGTPAAFSQSLECAI